MKLFFFFFFNPALQKHTEGTETVKLNVSEPAVWKYLRDFFFSRQGTQRCVEGHNTGEKREGRSERMEGDDPLQEWRDGTEVRARLATKERAPL